MAQWIKACASISGDLSVIPGLHVIEGENNVLQDVS